MRILIVEDDTKIASFLDMGLTQSGYAVDVCSDGEEGLVMAQTFPFDAAIFDRMLPGMDGLQLLRKLREHSAVPVIMLTARGEVTDRIVGLELGADDYMPKPFEPRELLARVQSILRRSQSPSSMLDIIKFKGLIVNKLSQEVELDGNVVHLSTTEFEALLLFVENPGEVLDREFLVENIRGITWQTYDRSVDVLVSRLRNKLGETPTNTRFIKTIHGVGYKFIGIPKN